MYLIDYAYQVVPTTSEPTRDEDPFSLMSHEIFKDLYQKVQAERGADVRIAIAFANCFGGWTFCDPQVQVLMDRGPRRVSAFLSVAWFPAAPQGRITIKEQLRVPALTFSAEFYAFYDALSICRFWLDQGVCDVAFAGAAETVGSPFLQEAFAFGVEKDVAVWFVLAKEGGEPINLYDGSPSLPLGDIHDVTGHAFQGTPLRGACALPLLLLEAQENQPHTIRVPGRGWVCTNGRGIEVWRRDNE